LRNQIFISYSHKDKEWLDTLQVNLKPFLREMPTVVAWDDRRITAGANWEEEISSALSVTKIAVCLVSTDFITSDFIYQKELPYLMKAADAKELTVIPIPVGFSAWKTTPLKSIQWAHDPDKPLNDLDEADREKALVQISELIAAFLKDGPPVDRLTDEISKQERDTVKASQSAEEGLRALGELMLNPEVHGKVATFEAVFSASLKQIEILGYYKDLHDLLHTLQFSCYSYLTSLVRNAKLEPDDISIWDNFIQYERALDQIIVGLRKSADPSLTTRIALPWIQKLLADLTQVFHAISENNIEGIATAIRPIQRVLATEPSRINDRLAAAAEAIQLPMLIDALVGVRNSIDVTGVNREKVNKFGNGVNAICDLKEKLYELIENHNRWQEIDIDFRRIEGLMTNDYSELENSWPDLKAMTESQVVNIKDDWALLLARDIQKLDAALVTADLKKIRQAFQSVRTRANYRFYDVDLSLKDLCDKLRKVGEPLSDAWKMIR
jgi:hypothetical protein